jgi:hypothetical protein
MIRISRLEALKSTATEGNNGFSEIALKFNKTEKWFMIWDNHISLGACGPTQAVSLPARFTYTKITMFQCNELIICNWHHRFTPINFLKGLAVETHWLVEKYVLLKWVKELPLATPLQLLWVLATNGRLESHQHLFWHLLLSCHT